MQQLVRRGSHSLFARFATSGLLASMTLVSLVGITLFVGKSAYSASGGPNCARAGTFQQMCGGPGTSPCNFTSCLSGSGTCTAANGDQVPVLGSKNVSIQTWYFCYTYNAAFQKCTVGLAPCGVTFDYEDEDTCVNICSGSWYWQACAALQGSTPCKGS
jgi:hypothetical protein